MPSVFFLSGRWASALGAFDDGFAVAIGTIAENFGRHLEHPWVCLAEVGIALVKNLLLAWVWVFPGGGENGMAL